MNNIVNGVFINGYAVLAALCSFRLLFRSRFDLALFYPERVFAFEQSALHVVGRIFPARPDRPEPGLPSHPGPDLRVVAFGPSPRAGLPAS